MIIIRSNGFEPGDLALSHHSRSNCRGELSARGVRPALVTSVYRLRGLQENQFKAFFEYIDKLIEPVKVGEKDLKLNLKLILPPLADLRAVNFEVLLGRGDKIKIIEEKGKGNEMKEILRKANSEIFAKCVRPKEKPKIDFSLLPWLNKAYVENEMQKLLSE